jgi:hypothetical protein
MYFPQKDSSCPNRNSTAIFHTIILSFYKMVSGEWSLQWVESLGTWVAKKKKKRERENEQKLQKGETKTTYVDDLQLFLHVASSWGSRKNLISERNVVCKVGDISWRDYLMEKERNQLW